MMLASSYLFLAFLSASTILANVEKTIFIAPPALSLPDDSSIDNLYLISLSHNFSSVRTKVNATFPDDEHPKGTETWMLLEGLQPRSRYEVRICWLATQPTAFSLYTHNFDIALGTPELISSLTEFAYARQAELSQDDLEKMLGRRVRPSGKAGSASSSLLLLQIFAAADYFSLNQTLMENVPPVVADVILDRYLLNIFPQSLVPTAIYITSLAVISWFVAGYIRRLLVSVAKRSLPDEKKSS